MKLGLGGDPHVTIGDKEEFEKIIDYIIYLKKKGEMDRFVFLGDLFHNHALVRLEVWDFWRTQIKKLKTVFLPGELYFISGNHDIPGNKENSGISAIQSLEDGHSVFISKGSFKENGILFVPYQFNESDFIKICKDNADCHTVICHQTFDGAKYDNGMYAPDGFDRTKIPNKNIISGHIHTSMEFGNVFYPGIARWTSATDADQQKGIWIIDIDENGNYSKELFSTENIVIPMKTVEFREGDDLPTLGNAKYLIHLIGSSEWIVKTKKKFNGHKIKTTYTDALKRKTEVKKVNSFEEFLKEYETLANKRDILELLGKL